MATTENGIYYPTDGTQPADVLSDMKKMAESIDETINDNTYDDTKIKEDILKIKEEQETQNKIIEENAENIEDNATDIQDLKEENANLKAQIPTGTAAGEEISLQDSAEMELVDFSLQGNSRQETLKGIQILHNTNEGATGWNVNSGDGVYTISSVVEDNINCMKALCTEQCNSYRLLRRDANLEKLKNNTDYTIQMDVKMNKTGQLSLSLKNQDSSNVLLDFGNLDYTTANTWQTFKVKATSYATEINEQVVYIGLNPIYEVNDYIEIRNLILAEGDYNNTDLEWEPYTNLTLKPSLDYPSEVEAVGDNINLYPYENIPFQSDTTTESWCYVDGKIGAYGNTVTDKTDYKITLEKGKYYFKLETDDSNIITGGLVANDTNSEKQLTLFDNAFEITETTVCTLRLKVANPSLGINIKSIKLEKGTAATPYSPYGQGSIEIVKSNKNLINNLPSTTTINGITFTNNGDGTITINGTATSVAYIVLKTLTLEDIDYSISGCPQGGSNETYSQYIFIPSTGGGLANDFGKGATLRNSNKPTVEVRLRIASGYKANNLIFRPQLEKGAATNFVENESKTYIISVQKPFYKIGKYLDSFVKQDKKWYEQHYIKELVLAGEESIDRNTVFENSVMVNTAENELYNPYVPTDFDATYVMCNMLKATSRNDCYSDISVGGKTALGNTTGRLFITIANIETGVLSSDNDTTMTNKIKTWLQELYNAGTPIKIYYVLATPELIECTAEQTQILEQIIKDGTYKGVTHFYTTEDLKPTIEVKYYKDLETLFKNQANMQATLNNVQAQILELGGN